MSNAIPCLCTNSQATSYSPALLGSTYVQKFHSKVLHLTLNFEPRAFFPQKIAKKHNLSQRSTRKAASKSLLHTIEVEAFSANGLQST